MAESITNLPGSPVVIGQRAARVYAKAAPGANTDILTTGIKPSDHCTMYRVYVVLATSSVLNYTVTDGTTAYTVGMNSSAALNAGDGYVFYFPVSKTDDGTMTGTALTYNFQVETDGVIRELIVDEIIGGV